MTVAAELLPGPPFTIPRRGMLSRLFNKPRACMLPPDEKNLLWDLIWKEALEAIALVDKDGTFLDVNPKWCDVVGYTAHELVGSKFHKITHPEDLDDDVAMTESLIRGVRDSFDMWKRYLHKRGHVVWVKLRVSKFVDENGDFKYFLSQVVPSTLIEQDVVSVGDGKNGVVPLQSAEGLVAFLRAHWKWIVPAGASVCYALFQAYHQWQMMLQQIEAAH